MSLVNPFDNLGITPRPSSSPNPMGPPDERFSPNLEQFIGPPNFGYKQPQISVPRSIWIVQLSKPSNKLEIQNVPKHLEYDFKNKYVVLHSPGRNNPFYHYTGSEDTLEFPLTWYAAEENRLDVITKCKWLESMSKNNGYKGKPELVALTWSSTWGDLNNTQNLGNLFEFGTWLIDSAAYSLSLFHGSRNMMPTLATQTVKLLRTTKLNRTRNLIADYRY